MMTRHDPIDLANLIRQNRIRKGWTQDELAKRSGISRPSIGSYEEYRAEPHLDNFLKLVEAFGFETVDAFLKGEWHSSALVKANKISIAYHQADDEKQKIIDFILKIDH